MLKNYIKLAYRNLVKHKLSSFINITGLAVAVACSIIFFLLLDMEYTSDRFHENVKNIYMVGYTLEGDEESRRWGDSTLALAPALEEEFPQIEGSVRIADRSATVRYENKIFSETIRFVDPNFLEVFTFPLAEGEKTALRELNGLVLSEQQAIKYFGEKNPIGKRLEMSFGQSQPEPFTVLGVARKFLHNASFSFGILASFNKYEDLIPQERNDWATSITASFIQIKNPDDIQTIALQTEKFIEHLNASNFDRPTASFVFEPLATLSWESQEIERSISSGSTPQALILLFIIGLFLLLQACFNYVNIALASGSRRNKEIGIRKVVGCQRFQLVFQFLGENLLLCFVALVSGLLLVEFVFLPGLMGFMGDVEKLTLLDLVGSWHLWLYLAVLLLVTGIGAGAYPALVISRLQPVSIMKAKVKLGGKRKFAGFLLSFQFGIAFVIICLVVAFLQNNRYQQRRDWGYDEEHVINVQLEKGEQFRVLRDAAAQMPQVIRSAGSKHGIGRSGDQAVVEFEGEKHEVVRLETGAMYLETLDIKLTEGRFFRTDLSTDRDSAIVVNERFLQEMGWSSGVDRAVRFDNRLFTVVGVIQDFHYEFFFEEIKPAFFRLVPEEDFRILALRVEPGTGVQTNTELQEMCRRIFPDQEYASYFQDSVFERGFQNNKTITKIFSATAFITLIISCMGLFGLVTLIISKRLKEFSLHKVLGASTCQIARLISRRFALLLMAAVFMGLPLSYFLLQGLLDGVYKYHMPLGAVPFVFGALTVLVAAAATIATQVYRAAVRNPIDALRYE